MTPKETYEKMCQGEDVGNAMDAAQAKISKRVLRRQAGELAAETCVESISFTPEDMEPWGVTLLFSNGELSHEGQLTLAKMQHNSHRAVMTDENGAVQISFFVYTNA